MYRDIWIKFMLNLVKLHKLRYALVSFQKFNKFMLNLVELHKFRYALAGPHFEKITDKYTTEIYMSYTYP